MNICLFLLMNMCLFLLINIYRSSRTALLIINYKQVYFKGEPPTEYASFPENIETANISILHSVFVPPPPPPPLFFKLKIYYN